MNNDDSINKLIENSGMITHHKVIEMLREEGWSLSIAPYYYDNISNTVREIDIVAEKAFNSADTRSHSSAQVNVQLFIECKYIKQDIVFWFDDKDIDRAVAKLEKDTNLKIFHKRYGADLAKEELHYLDNSKVAKLFSAGSSKEDVIYKAITQCLNSKIYYDQWFNNPIHNDFSGHREAETLIMKYPVIVCNDFNKFFKATFTREGYSYEKIDTNFQLETNYVFLDKTKTKANAELFLIDIVSFNQFKTFLDIIEKEARAFVKAGSYKIS